ncbi:unnamed protein product [Amoebophrya sp. A120]|nr:unnamed protein product [Amoebophrya sp. A120]|eukprot:GSA120T00011443001.1
MVIRSDDDDSDAESVQKPTKKARLGGAKTTFVSKQEREKREREEADKEREAQRRREQEATRKRKQFLFADPRDAERQRERQEREFQRKIREQERATKMGNNPNNIPLGNGASAADGVAVGNGKASSSKAPPKQVEVKKAQSTLRDLGLLSNEQYESAASSVKTGAEGTANSAELWQLKKNYLGLRDEKRKLQKPSEKFRNIFNFEWAADDDTFRGDTNELYTKRPEPQLLFGRGYRAGMDVREQRKTNTFYENMISVRAEATGEEVGSFLSNREAMLQKKEDRANADDEKHWSAKPVSEMTVRDWKIFREDHQIVLRGGRVPPPMRNWAEAPLPVELLDAVNKCGYTAPTPVQMQAIPVACALRDLIAIAETGSGKTAAYALPLLRYLHDLPQLDNESAQMGPYAVILCPSHELAFQIETEVGKFKHFIPHIRTVTLVGGQGGRDAEKQAFEIRNGVELVIATPGRLVDAIDKRHTVLHQCNYVILDEADRMIAPGMQEYLYRTLDAIPSTNLKAESEDAAVKQELELLAGHRKFRITQMYGATIPPPLERLARKYCRHPSVIQVGDPSGGNKNIDQRVKMMQDADKRKELENLIKSEDFEVPAMVFVNQKRAADVLAKWLDSIGKRAGKLHSGMLASDRQAALEKFKGGQLDFLIATDVGARGLHVEGLPHVICFDMATSIDEYKQRIGRTGRLGKKGISTTFLTPADEGLYFELKEFLIACEKQVPHELSSHEAAKVKPGTITESGHMAGAKTNVVYSSTFRG